MLVKGSQEQFFFFLQTLLFTPFDATVQKNYNIRACEHIILGQLRMGARHRIYAPLPTIYPKIYPSDRPAALKATKNFHLLGLKNSRILKRVKTLFISVTA